MASEITYTFKDLARIIGEHARQELGAPKNTIMSVDLREEVLGGTRSMMATVKAMRIRVPEHVEQE